MRKTIQQYVHKYSEAFVDCDIKIVMEKRSISDEIHLVFFFAFSRSSDAHALWLQWVQYTAFGAFHKIDSIMIRKIAWSVPKVQSAVKHTAKYK